ncbi:MAG: hypothetical protein K9L86_05215 [Candidatus Omnitrophica bacterium]|nr:hypothetical protein [Candidatus Omnitrophota bacterium]
MNKKSEKKYISVKTKLFSVILLVIVVAVAANSLITIFSFKVAYKEALEEKSYAVGKALRRTVHNNLRYFSLDEFSGMDEYLQSVLFANEGIDYCFIADRDGKILYHAKSPFFSSIYDKGKYGDLYPLKTSQRRTLVIGKYYESIIPIPWFEEVIGTINVGIKQEIINSKIRKMRAQNLLVLLLALGFCIFLFYQSLSRIVIVPISKLLGAIRYIISHKEFGRHTEVKGNDEIGDLASLFNTMTDELKKYQDHLEELVDERTLELKKEISERKRVEEKLREAVEYKSKLTSMVSHELRTPLAAIKTSISIVFDGLAGDTNTEQKNLLSMAKKNVNRLARLINDVLEFQKLEAGKMELRLKEDDVNEVVRDVYEIMQPLAERKGLQFSLKLGQDLPKPRFDKDRISQVISNLVSNAIKFTKKGEVIVVTRKIDNSIEVEVFDTGIGIKKNDIPKLFHSFEQIKPARSGKVEGTGLGLAICKDIIQEHKGKIEASSKGEGKGSRFIFTLPV